MSLVAAPSSAAADSHPDYTVADIAVAHMVVVRIAVVHMVVAHTAEDFVQQREVDYHTLHKSVYRQHFAYRMHYKRHGLPLSAGLSPQ